MLEKLTTLDELHDEVDAVCLLEDVVHANDEWMVHLVQYELLNLQRLDRLVLDNHIFPNAFHRLVLVVQLVVNQVYLAKSSPSNDADQLEIFP